MANVAHTHVEHERTSHVTARTLSIFAALAVDAGLVWLLYFHAKYNPPVGEAEMFWERVVAAFGVYTVLQHSGHSPTRLAAVTISPRHSTSSLRLAQS